MGLHVYCIVPRGHAPDAELAGVAAARVLPADAGQVGIWYSTHDEPTRVDARAIVAHNAVIQSAMTPAVTPVPVRFGQWFATLDSAVDRIAGEEAKWAAELARFAGCAEYGVRVLSDAVPEPARDVRRAPAASGTAYMAALARRHAEAEHRRAAADAVTAWLADTLAHAVTDSRVEILDADGLVSCAYLVARERVDDYHATLVHVRRSRPDLRFLYTGPWPPYSFVA